MTPDYSKGCARYDEITCDCDLSTNQCKGRDYYEQIQCGTIKSLKAQLSSKDQECEELAKQNKELAAASENEGTNWYDLGYQHGAVSEINQHIESENDQLRAENERLTIMATDAELLRAKLDYKTEENKRNILAINDLRKRCEDLEAERDALHKMVLDLTDGGMTTEEMKESLKFKFNRKDI